VTASRAPAVPALPVHRQRTVVETVNAELAVRDEDDVALYARLFEMYWEIASHDEHASAVITRVALDLPT
jgi:hypothetical protein